MSPYLLPEGNVQIAFSGGRTSGYMLHHILEANGGLPDRCRVVFTNTGREMPETLDFVAECGSRWGVQIVWAEYRGEKPWYEIVSHNSASRNGEPFRALIDKRKVLPNQGMRFCTIELKLRTAKRYFRSLGWKEWHSALGLRADEQHRLNKKNPTDCGIPWAPLVAAGVAKGDVAAFWRRQPFDLRLPNVNGNSWLGNCDGCFLKSEASIASLTRMYPERAKWWEEQEERLMPTRSWAGRWSERYTRRELREFMERQGDLALSTEGMLCQANDGECFG